jgi:Uma2 family endonuclease
VWWDTFPTRINETEYESLPEDICRRIEVVHGHIIRSESPAPRHNRVARRLANALEKARPGGDTQISVDTFIDVVLWRAPNFTFRRPDVVLYRRIDGPGRKPTAQETLAVVEVSSPTTLREDLIDKKAQYAAAGIPLYLVVILDEKYELVEVREFHLDSALDEYRLYGIHRSVLELTHPMVLSQPLSGLVV